jgi:hypothetical protein
VSKQAAFAHIQFLSKISDGETVQTSDGGQAHGPIHNLGSGLFALVGRFETPIDVATQDAS